MEKPGGITHPAGDGTQPPNPLRLCTFALLYPALLAGGEDLTQRRRESQRIAESSSSLRFSAFLCVSALSPIWSWLRLGRAAPLRWFNCSL